MKKDDLIKKLKDENDRLHRDIYKLVMAENTEEALMTKIHYATLFDAEEHVFFVNVSPMQKETEYKGIWAHLKDRVFGDELTIKTKQDI